MNTATPCVLRVERVDDIPVLFASLQRLQVAEFLDRHFPTHHLWKGELSFGEVVCVWLVFLTCQGDHRLYHLLPWVEEHLLTLQRRFSRLRNLPIRHSILSGKPFDFPGF